MSEKTTIMPTLVFVLLCQSMTAFMKYALQSDQAAWKSYICRMIKLCALNYFHTGSYDYCYWYLYSSEVPKQCEICQKAINGETPDPVHCQKCQREIEAESKQTEDESQDQTSVIGQLSQQPNQSQQGSVIALQDQMGRKVVVVGNTMTMTNQKIQALPHIPSTVIQVISGHSSDTFFLYRGTYR